MSDKSLRDAAKAVLYDHAHSIVAAIAEGILDDEEAAESLDLNRTLARELGIREDKLPRPLQKP